MERRVLAPSRFILRITSGYMADTAVTAKAAPAAMPATMNTDFILFASFIFLPEKQAPAFSG